MGSAGSSSASRVSCVGSPRARRCPARRSDVEGSSRSDPSPYRIGAPVGPMRQRLHEYLVGRPAGASPDELLDLIFISPGRDSEFGRRLLTTLLGTDPRFHFDRGADRWRARIHDALARPLGETTFVVVDLETTGGAPNPEGIIEIGAVRVAGGRLLDT